MQQSVHFIARLLERSPCETSLRYHPTKLSIDDLEAVNTAILGHALSSVLTPGTAYTVAIDFTHDPYYGTVVPDNEGFIIRSRLEKSTNDFYSYVTVNAITRDRRVTLTVYSVTEGASRVAFIAPCLDAITATGLKIQALCLDREFYTRKVIAFLKTVQVPFILPVRKHSRAMKHLPNVTRARFGEYIMRGKPALHPAIAVTVLYAKGQREKHGVENFGYVVNGVPRSPRRIHETYRSRFGIESSYRMLEAGQTQNLNLQSGDPLPLRHHLVPLKIGVIPPFIRNPGRFP
ncbi:MAG: transposase [Methanospirillum sp.]